MARIERPWRKSPPWNSETLESLKTDIRTISLPHYRDIRHVNILMIGPINAGKSSFFNTISSIFKERVTSQACCGSAEKSTTSTFRTYRVREKSSEKLLPFRLCDTRGLEEEEMLDERELNYVLSGNIFDGYEHGSLLKMKQKKKSTVFKVKKALFKTFSQNLEIPGFRESSSSDNEIHCVCFVLDGSTASVMSDPMVNKIKQMQSVLRKKGVPQLFLITKIDKVCHIVTDNMSKVFYSPDVLDIVERTATSFGVPRIHVLPIKNFENEADVSLDISILALQSLKLMLSTAEDYLLDRIDRTDQGDETRSSDSVS